MAATYLLASTQRSGSTWVADLLQRTGVAGRPVTEYWNLGVEFAAHQQRRFRTYYEYLQHVRGASATRNGVRGVNIMWRQMPGALERMRRVAGWENCTDIELWHKALPGLSKFVFTYREDTLAQAVSWARAIQTQKFTSRDEGNGREPEYLFWLIDALLGDIHAHNLGWESWFERFGIHPLRVKYEDVLADPAGQVREVLRHLGVAEPRRITIASQFSPQRDGLNAEWRERWLKEQSANHITPRDYLRA